MNARTALAVAVSCALLCATAAAADLLRDPWAGFAPGSFVHQRTTTRTSVANRGDSATESRTTLVAADGPKVRLKSEFRVADGTWQAQEITIDPGAQGAVEAPRPEPLGEEKVTVDGRELVCRKQRTVAAGVTTVSWVHPDLGVVRSESRSEGAGRTDVVLEKLAEKVRAGKDDVECRRVRTITTSAVGTSETAMWLSPAVPGGVARSETLTVQGSVRVTMFTETVEFLARRP
jgi:hypothetical protein